MYQLSVQDRFFLVPRPATSIGSIPPSRPTQNVYADPCRLQSHVFSHQAKAMFWVRHPFGHCHWIQERFLDGNQRKLVRMVSVCRTLLHKSVINIRRLILAASGTGNHISSHYNSVPVVWKASSTIPSSSSEAARWNTENTFFQPDLMLWACECTICATQRTTMSRIVADLWLRPKNKNTLLSKAKHEKKTIHDQRIF